MSYSAKMNLVSSSAEWLTCDNTNCSQSGPSNMCSKCHRSYYCSLSCQKKHWPTHKVECVSYKEKMLEMMEQPLLTLSTTDDICGDCKRPVEVPVFLACGHVVCLRCALTDFLSKDEKCGDCGQAYDTNRLAPGVGILTLLFKQLDTTEKVARRILSDSALVDKDSQYDAKQAVRKALDAYNVLNVLLQDGEDLRNLMHRLVRTDGLYLLQKGRFHVLAGEPDEAMKATERGLIELVDHAEKEILRQLERNEGSRDRLLEVRKLLSEHKHKVLYDAYKKKLVPDHRQELLQAYIVLAKSNELAEKPTDALTWYNLVPPSDPDHKFLCGEALIARIRVNRETGQPLSLRSIEGDVEKLSVTPGIHMALSEQLQESGDLEKAKNVMNKALFYEAPWDKVNKQANTTFIGSIYETERRLEELRIREERFVEVWGEVINTARVQKKSNDFVSWESVKMQRYDMFAEFDEDDEVRQRMRDDALSKLRTAAADAALEKHEDDEGLDQVARLSADQIGESFGVTTKRLGDVKKPCYERIKLTKQVTKWLSGAGRGNDLKLRDIFLQRMKQLAAGDRSRILQKRLIGSKNMNIYETYMDGNFRILWTEDTESDSIHLGLVIWFVSPHDNVSRCMEKIDDAVSRSSRQMITTTASSLPEFAADEDDLAPNNVLLDPESDTPLKLYLVRYDDIPRLNSSWRPPLYLTREERLIVEKEGTVLLLGRSGTGKTVCICNRIDFDRHLAENDPTYSALFIARSKRICRYVQDSVGLLAEDSRDFITFSTFEAFLRKCEERLFGPGEHFTRDNSKYVSFQQFKEIFGNFDCGDLDPLVVWTSIKSFIKGSIEAVIKGEPLSREDYLDNEKIGSRRCRLSPEQRDKVYDVFLKYQQYMNRGDRDRWDDCDRITKVVKSLRSDWNARKDLARRRVYVDEVQDYTQCEIALFFLVSDRGGLFLAGDPAQSVVEGVEFRFEEVRSVAWNLFDEIDRPKYVPSKPLTVNRNFRSHKGILNLAGEILDRLFETFPGSAKELPKDEGLFKGPRPSIMQNVKPNVLKQLVEKIDGVVLLTMSDDTVAELEKLVGSDIVVLSIRDSKGLEFSDVIIVDFFKDLAPEHQKPWKLLIQGKVEDELKGGFPELETHLKQLYTAVTRCTNHLFFAETARSESGQAFFRRLTEQLKLATKQSVDDVEKMEKSADEWRTLGVQYAMYAEAERDPTFWMTKAIFCFKQSDDTALVAKAELHLESITFRSNEDLAIGLSEEAFVARVAGLFMRLFDEGLMVEARRVYDRVLPLFDDFIRSNLQNRLEVSLPLLEDYE